MTENKIQIKPKTAVIEIQCPIDDFFFVWDDDKENQPTQKDYDNWAIENARSFLEFEVKYNHNLDKHIILK